MTPIADFVPAHDTPVSNCTPVKPIDSEHEISWDQIRHYASSNRIKELHRNPQVQVVYDQWRKSTLETYGSIENYLLATKISFPSGLPNRDRPPVVILPNDFPYAVEPGIYHILIWSQISLKQSYIEEILEDRCGHETWEWVYFVNSQEKQSVRKLPHTHVFMRKRRGHTQA